MMRIIGSMDKLSVDMDFILERLRRRERAARNAALRARLARAGTADAAFSRLRSLAGLNAKEREFAPDFA